MRASGANSTHKHMEEVSLCAMFLMDVAKRVDRMFGVTQSIAHTVRDANKDVTKMVGYLLSEKITIEVEQRQVGIIFEDPSIAGSRCIADGHIDSYLKDEVDDEDISDSNVAEEEVDNIMDINYELYDVV